MAKDGTAHSNSRRIAPWLWALLTLFCLRVLGQIGVALGVFPFLPPMEEWMSGAVPYFLLLPSQFLIIWLLATVSKQFSRAEGWFVRPHRNLGVTLQWWGFIYLLAMIVRYAVRMALYPPERWTGLSIPMFFHWVLATYVLIFAFYHARLSPRLMNWKRWVARGLGVVGIAAVGVVWVAYLMAPAWIARDLGWGPPKHAVMVEGHVPLTTSDGTKLVADIFHPRRAKDAPTILVRLPYSKSSIPQRLAAHLVGRMWAEHGYHVMIQGVRGRYESEGEHIPFATERQDGIDTLAWLKGRSWFNGKLGMWGGSYFGYTQWALADQTDPGPSALDVQLASTSFYDMFYPGGAFSLESALYWALRSGGPDDRDIPSSELNKGYGGFPLAGTDDRAGMDVSFFDEWTLHPRRDDYWKAVDGTRRWESLRCPVLFIAGWFDPFLPSELVDFERVRQHSNPKVAQESCLIVGPWAHAYAPTLPDGYEPRNYRLDSLESSLPWFDRHLRGDHRASKFPPVRLFVMGENVWRDEQEWPLARTQYVPYFFDNGRIEMRASRESKQMDYMFDPKNPVRSSGGAMLGPRAGPRRQSATSRPDVLAFASSPLKEDMEITGPIKAILYVQTSAPSTDFTVSLMDVHPNGSAYYLSEGILRREYKKGPSAGEKAPEKIEVSMWPTSILLRKGHSLRVQISSSLYPRFDVNPNTGRPIFTETKPVVAHQAVFFAGGTPSHIVLPVIPR